MQKKQVQKRVNILGVGISALNLVEAIRQIDTWIEDGLRHYVNVCTVHTVMECQQNLELNKIVNKSGMATPDGMPLVWVCHYYGHKHVTRVYGPDLMLALCEFSLQKGYRHYFYGGAKGVAEKLSKVMKKRLPGLIVAGVYTPPFRAVGDLEETSVIESINYANPDVVWVGLGTPKQDFWMAQHRPLLNAPILIGVGAAFDFITGRVPQASLWMQRCGLEWLFRLWQEPRRLTHRYLVFNTMFVMNVLIQIIGLRRYQILQ